MSTQAPPVPAVRPLADLTELTKPGITLMVVITAAIGLLLAGGLEASAALWFHTLLGTGLVAGGASALNHVRERDTDARMRRTANRPLPSGRLGVEVATLFGVLVTGAGLVELLLAVNPLTAALGALAVVGYVFIYTPMKRRTSLSTLVGGFPGSIPPMMGWTAMRDTVELPAWVLFGILYFWQMPHFLAIAWLCREDYARAGFPMLSVLDPDGRETGRQAVLYCLPLLPISLLPAVLDLAGWVYAIGGLILGGVYLGYSLGFARRPSRTTARRLMLFSLLYLPALLAALVLDYLFF
ncbi:MAG: heme o synthase [Thermoanaerobaculia bacterium]